VRDGAMADGRSARGDVIEMPAASAFLAVQVNPAPQPPPATPKLAAGNYRNPRASAYRRVLAAGASSQECRIALNLSELPNSPHACSRAERPRWSLGRPLFLTLAKDWFRRL
jgi:hypothetical protein